MRTLDTKRKDQVTVEAESVEDALAEISSQFGANAEIMRAQKVHRGGVGGFFAKEMVQLTARRRRQAAPAMPEPQPATGAGIAGVLERMAQDADAEDSDFRTVLRRELGEDDPSGDALAVAAGWEPEATLAPEPADSETAAFVEASPEENLLAALTADPDTDTIDSTPEPIVVGPVLMADIDVESLAVEPVVEEIAVAEIVPSENDGDPDVLVAETIEDSPESDELAAEVVLPFPAPVEPEFEEAASTEIADNETSVEADVDWWRTAETVDAPTGMGSVPWSTTALLRLGLPAPVIAAIADLDGKDDLGWIDAIAATVAPYCGQLPEGDVIIVGPHAERLAEPLGLPLVHSGDMAPYKGSFCAMVEDSSQDRQWLEYVQGGRGIHLVVGDEPWHDLLIDEPVAVSWVGESAVVDALYLAFTLGATLGFGTVDGFVSSMVRPQPTDVALAIRRIVGRQ